MVRLVRTHFPDLCWNGRSYGVPRGHPGDSLTVYYDAAWKFKRFSTGQHGDVLDFIRDYEGAASFAEAVAAADAVRSGATERPSLNGGRAGNELGRRDRPSAPPGWLKRGPELVERFASHPEKYVLWRRYKPLTTATVDRWLLGVGRLPAVPCRENRLIYPVYQDGQLVALRGRALTEHACPDPRTQRWIADGRGGQVLDPDSGEVPRDNEGNPVPCPTWYSAGGSKAALWGWDLLDPEVAGGKNVTVTENPIDAMLVMQVEPSVVAVAVTAGASTWRPEWSLRIARSRPKEVTVWYDNDLAGAPNSETLRAMAKEWRCKHPAIANVPAPNGPKIVAQLRELSAQHGGFQANVFPWPPGTPRHYDMGQYLAEYMRQGGQ